MLELVKMKNSRLYFENFFKKKRIFDDQKKIDIL